MRDETYSNHSFGASFYRSLVGPATLLRRRRYEIANRIGLFFRQGRYLVSENLAKCEANRPKEDAKIWGFFKVLL